MTSKNLLLALSLFFGTSLQSLGNERLSIISPHRKSIQNEYIPLFEAYYKKEYGQDISVEWIDQGGTENDLRFIEAKYEKSPNSSGIDIFWGGGDMTFHDLEKKGYLQKLPDEFMKLIPAQAVGIPLASKSGSWLATAISSFGIFYNKRLVKFQNLSPLTSWEDLGQSGLLNLVSVADPRRSSTSLMMSLIILKSLEWERGWEALTKMAANARSFTHSSSDPIKAVVTGDAAAATAVDFYAAAKIAELGEQNLGFVLPEGKTVFNSDPIAVLKGAPNKKAAERFVKFVVSPQAQKLLVLKQGSKEGPKMSVLGRMAVHPKAYEADAKDIISPNPFTLSSAHLVIDLDKLTQQKEVISDLIGAIHCDTHKELQQAWKVVLAKGAKPQDIKNLTTPPISQAEFEALTKVWGDQLLRNRTINQWVNDAKAKYIAIAEQRNG